MLGRVAGMACVLRSVAEAAAGGRRPAESGLSVGAGVRSSSLPLVAGGLTRQATGQAAGEA